MATPPRRSLPNNRARSGQKILQLVAELLFHQLAGFLFAPPAPACPLARASMSGRTVGLAKRARNGQRHFHRSQSIQPASGGRTRRRPAGRRQLVNRGDELIVDRLGAVSRVPLPWTLRKSVSIRRSSILAAHPVRGRRAMRGQGVEIGARGPGGLRAGGT